MSVTEGEDKPLKNPLMFQKADLVLLTKIDRIPHLDYDVAAVEDALARVMPNSRLLWVSARSGEGIDRWLQWLEERRPAASSSRDHMHPHSHSHEHCHAPR